MAVYYGKNAPQRPGRVSFDWIDEGWFLFKQAPVTWVVAILLMAIVYGIDYAAIFALTPRATVVPGTSLFDAFLHGSRNMSLLPQIPAALIGAFVDCILFGLAVRQVRGVPIRLGDMFAGLKYYLPMLLLKVLEALVNAAGGAVNILVTLVLGFVVLALLMPAGAMIADGVSARASIELSFKAMSKDWLRALGFAFVLSLLIGASMFVCGVGLLATVPIFYLCGALAYRDMVGMDGYIPPSENVPPQPGVWPPPPSQS